MAYATGTASSQEDLMNALQTFALAQGWTINIFNTTNDWLYLNNGSSYVGFRWDNTQAIAMFHSRGFTSSGTAPGNHTDDDGCGTVDASAPYNALISTGRRITIANGPYTAYHFFTDGTTKYIHVVVEYSPGIYRHFSFGSITKRGTWIGGEYAVAHAQAGQMPSPGPVLWSGTDGGSTAADANECGSLHIESFPNQTVGQGKWMVFSTQTTTLGNDRQSTPRARIACPGGMYGYNPWLGMYGFFRANLLNGFIPLIPVPIWWRDTVPAPDQVILLGFVPDVFHVQMASLSAGQEFTIGAETYKVFPLVRKQDISVTEESKNFGVCYRKVP